MNPSSNPAGGHVQIRVQVPWLVTTIFSSNRRTPTRNRGGRVITIRHPQVLKISSTDECRNIRRQIRRPYNAIHLIAETIARRKFREINAFHRWRSVKLQAICTAIFSSNRRTHNSEVHPTAGGPSSSSRSPKRSRFFVKPTNLQL